MNLRQKAKRFKKLYEEILKAPVPVTKVHGGELKHYACTYLYDKCHEKDLYMKENPSFVKRNISKQLINKMTETIIDNIEITADKETGVELYKLDIWLKGE